MCFQVVLAYEVIVLCKYIDIYFKLKITFLGYLLGSLHGSAGLQAGHGSGSKFFSTVLDSASAFSARLAHSGVLLRVDFLSLRTFIRLCNSLEVVVDWEMSQLVAHQ